KHGQTRGVATRRHVDDRGDVLRVGEHAIPEAKNQLGLTPGGSVDLLDRTQLPGEPTRRHQRISVLPNILESDRTADALPNPRIRQVEAHATFPDGNRTGSL